MALNKDDKNFVVHMVALSIVDSNIHLSWHIQIVLLQVEKVTIPSKYADYIDVFSSDSMAELPKHTDINDHLINLRDNKQSPYSPIYSLGLVELKTLKTYIETTLANSFIRPFKSPAGAPILFIHKRNGSLCLYIDY